VVAGTCQLYAVCEAARIVAATRGSAADECSTHLEDRQKQWRERGTRLLADVVAEARHSHDVEEAARPEPHLLQTLSEAGDPAPSSSPGVWEGRLVSHRNAVDCEA